MCVYAHFSHQPEPLITRGVNARQCVQKNREKENVCVCQSSHTHCTKVLVHQLLSLSAVSYQSTIGQRPRGQSQHSTGVRSFSP